jgi:ubiquinone biosynthesis protein COQ9
MRDSYEESFITSASIRLLETAFDFVAIKQFSERFINQSKERRGERSSTSSIEDPFVPPVAESAQTR